MTFEKAEKIAEQLEITEPCVTPWWVPAIDGYRAAGRFADLERIVEWLDRGIVGLPCRWPRACSLAGKALLDEVDGKIDSAKARFAQALDQIEACRFPWIAQSCSRGKGASRTGRVTCRPQDVLFPPPSNWRRARELS